MEKTERIIQLWKELNVDSVHFEFSCGGDSMDDTTITINSKDGGTIENSEINDYFDRETYNNVEFYVNSDGHYQGESGTVYITLDDEEEDFNYNKQSQSEWNESVTSVCEVELTDKEETFIKDKVLNINGSYDSGATINYNRDLILSDEEEKLVEAFEEKLMEALKNHTPEQDEGELNEAWFTFTTNNEGEEIQIKDGLLLVNVDNTVTVFKED